MVIPTFKVKFCEVTTFVKIIQPNAPIFKLDPLLKDILIHVSSLKLSVFPSAIFTPFFEFEVSFVTQNASLSPVK